MYHKIRYEKYDASLQNNIPYSRSAEYILCNFSKRLVISTEIKSGFKIYLYVKNVLYLEVCLLLLLQMISAKAMRYMHESS